MICNFRRDIQLIFIVALLSYPDLTGSQFRRVPPPPAPASDFIKCSDLIDVNTINDAFDAYSAQNPVVTRENVNTAAGQSFRDALMSCPNICLLPFGGGNSDITGIGVGNPLHPIGSKQRNVAEVIFFLLNRS